MVSRRQMLKMLAASGMSPLLARCLSREKTEFGIPAKLSGVGIHFHDSRFIDPGIVSYSADRPITPSYARVPENLGRFFVCPVRTPAPLIEPRHPQEHFGVSLNTVLAEEDGFRGWGFAQDADRKSHLANFWSEDGRTWMRLQAPGRQDHFSDWQSTSFVQGAIFRDTSTGQPLYRIIDVTFDTADETLRNSNLPFSDNRAKRGDKIVRLIGGTSVDGFSWTPLDAPILVRHVDTQNIALWDDESGQYFYYVRDWRSPDQWPGDDNWVSISRRSLGLATGTKFGEIKSYRPLFEPDSFEDFGSPIYGACVTRLPEDQTVWFMIQALWRLKIDEFALAMSASRNGYVWTDHEVIFEPVAGDEGWDAGVIYPHPNMFVTASGDYAVPYTGFRLPHKANRDDWSFGAGLLLWPKRRLSYVAPRDTLGSASFSTVFVEVTERGFLPDLQIPKASGFTKFELRRLNGTVQDQLIVQGPFDDTKPIFSDSSLVSPGDWVAIDVTLKDARLYGL